VSSKRATALDALAVVGGLFSAIWIVQIINNFDDYRLSTNYGIEPHVISSLPCIFAAPFLHWSWAHIEGNSIPFLILGFLAALRGIPRFLLVSLIVTVTSGLFAWGVSPLGADTVGASGVIFGWLGYVVVRGFFNHHKVDIVIGLLVGINYFGFLSLLFPAPHLSYEGHIGGLIGGVLCGWLLRDRSVSTAPAQSLPAAAVDDSAAISSTSSPTLGKIEHELSILRDEVARERGSADDRNAK
jgi:membrane associated rhomboid family serine protease